MQFLTVFATEQIVLYFEVLLMSLQARDLVLSLALARRHITLLGPFRIGFAQETYDNACNSTSG